MEALLGAAVAIGACCGLPLLLVGGAALLGRDKKKAPHSRETPPGSHSVMHACCQAPLSIGKGAARWLFSRGKPATGRPASRRINS